MSDSNSAVLQRAYELIEAGQAAEARSLIESVLDSEQTNPDAWWIYAHAVDEPVRARQALDQVLDLDPQYPGASQLSDELEAQYPGAAEEARLAAPILPLPLISFEPEMAGGEDSPELLAAATPDADVPSGDEEIGFLPDEEPSFVGQVPPAPAIVPQEKRRGAPWYGYIAAAAAAILLLALIFALLRPAADVTPGLATEDANSTLVAGQPTLDTEAQALLETQQMAIALTDAALQAGGAGTAEATESVVATSEPLLPVATLPESSVVTLTPLPPDQPTEALLEVTTMPVVETATAENQLATLEMPVATLEGPGPGTADLAGIDLADGVLPFEALTALAGELSAFTAPATALTTETTPIGETMVASFCTQDGPELRDLTRQVMDTLSMSAGAMETGMNAVGARAVDCGTGQTLRLIAVDRGAATAFSSGTIDSELFESQWLSF